MGDADRLVNPSLSFTVDYKEFIQIYSDQTTGVSGNIDTSFKGCCQLLWALVMFGESCADAPVLLLLERRVSHGETCPLPSTLSSWIFPPKAVNYTGIFDHT